MELDHYQIAIPRLNGESVEAKRQEILAYFLNGFELFEKLFEPFKDNEVFYEQPEATRHPLIFYFGHTASFFINKLILSKAIETRIDPELEALFAIGVDEMQWDDLEQSHYQWPSVEKVRRYRDAVKTLLMELILTRPMELPIQWEDPFWWVILMGCEHERIHIETSSVLHRQLDRHFVRADPFWRISDDALETFPENQLVSVEAGSVTLGKNRHDAYYGWDNEYGSELESIDAFKVSKYLVSNGEFMAFVEAKGYEDESYWDVESWAWLKKDGRKLPYFWSTTKEGYDYRTMLQSIALPLNWPVEVNYYEAKAFCRFKSEQTGEIYRLPSEAEWVYLLRRYSDTVVQKEGNINLKIGSSCAVDRYRFGPLYDLVGNVWQWTQTPIDGYKGFEPHPMYDDFSTPTFDNQHHLIKGGSWISTGNETLSHSRYAFRKHFMQHAGFRYIQSDKEFVIKKVNSYESDTQVSQYCDFHYGPKHFGVENLALSLVEKALSLHDKTKMKRVLDLGCAVGRTSFELSKYFESVTGLDFSARFIQVGTHLQEGGHISYRSVIEGDIAEIKAVDLKTLGYEQTASKIEFKQADACNLKAHFTDYDLVIASNLIDRLYEPARFLEDIKHRVNSGGTLVICSPYTWLEEFTAKEHWLGGYIKEDGSAVRTIDALKAHLEDAFELIEAPSDLAFVIRETERKFQHTVAEVSVWKRL